MPWFLAPQSVLVIGACCYICNYIGFIFFEEHTLPSKSLGSVRFYVIERSPLSSPRVHNIITIILLLYYIVILLQFKSVNICLKCFFHITSLTHLQLTIWLFALDNNILNQVTFISKQNRTNPSLSKTFHKKNIFYIFPNFAS